MTKWPPIGIMTRSGSLYFPMSFRSTKYRGSLEHGVRGADRADGIGGGVGDEDHVHLAERVQVLVLGRRLRVVGEERVDHDDLAGERRELGRRLAEPVHFYLRGLRPGGLGGEGVGERARRELQEIAPLHLHECSSLGEKG